MLGGALTQALSWRWIFWINLPVSGVAFIVLLLSLELHDPKTPIMEGLKSVDWLGSISIMGLSLMLLMGLNFGGVTFSWKSSQVICLLVFGCVMLPIFIYCEKRLAKLPLMPLGIFGRVSNAACFCVNFCHGAVSSCLPSLPLCYMYSSFPYHVYGQLLLTIRFAFRLFMVENGISHYTFNQPNWPPHCNRVSGFCRLLLPSLS